MTVTTEGDTTIITAVDANGNATVTTKNNVNGESTSDTVTVNDSATITNGNVKVEVEAKTDATSTTTGIVDVGTIADAVTQAATTTTVEAPEIPIEVAEEPTVEVEVEEPEVTSGPEVVVGPEPAVVVGPEPAVVVGPEPVVDSDSDSGSEVSPVPAPYSSGIASINRMRPTATPRYQARQNLPEFTFYRPQPGVAQVTTQPQAPEVTSYLAPTGGGQYGYEYLLPNADPEYLARLAALQGTGADVQGLTASEELLNG